MNLTSTPVSTETKLIRMRELADSIKILEAELTMIKQELISTHFVNNEEYKTTKGLLLATYKPQVQTQFQQSRFKTDHNDIYQMYCEEKTIFKFLLK